MPKSAVVDADGHILEPPDNQDWVLGRTAVELWRL